MAAQQVQKRAYPDAYADNEEPAKRLAAFLAGVPDIAIIGGGGPGAECGPAANPSDGPVVISSGGVDAASSRQGDLQIPAAGQVHPQRR